MGWLQGIRERLSKRPGELLHIASDSGDGPVAILVHGIASSSVTFQELLPLLVDTHRAISIDILGFGESPAPADAEYTLEEHVEYLHRTIQSLGLTVPFVLVGHSLGALICARYASLYEAHINRLVLVGPPIYISPGAIGNPKVRKRVSAYMRVYEYIRQNKNFTLFNAAMIAKLMPIRDVFEITEQNWDAFVKSMQNCIESQTVVSDIASIHVPIDVIYGSLDAFIPPGGLDVIERMSHVTMHRVKVNDHLIRKRLARVIADAIT